MANEFDEKEFKKKMPNEINEEEFKRRVKDLFRGELTAESTDEMWECMADAVLYASMNPAERNVIPIEKAILTEDEFNEIHKRIDDGEWN